MAIIQYTGHPLVDVGAATITAFVKKGRPEDVTEEDLEEVINYIKDKYPKKPMSSLSSVVYTFNAPYTQNYDTKDKRYDAKVKRIEEMDKVLLANTPINEQCVFCGRSAVRRGVREQIPLASGRQNFNFYPEGNIGLPVCRACLVCLQAFPLGSLFSQGRELVVHSECDYLTWSFASHFLAANRVTLQAGSLDKMQNYGFPRTNLIKALLDLEPDEDAEQYCSITAYHLTNYGSSADVTIYHLPLATMRFLSQAHTPSYAAAWNPIVKRAWEQSPTASPKKAAKQAKGAKDDKPPRNYLYEDLFNLPQNAGHFLRTYFLRRPLAAARATEGDPRSQYSPARERQLISWPLTELFLEEVIGMTPDQTQAIQHLGEKLADYVYNLDERLFTNIKLARNYSELISLLEKANRHAARERKARLFDFEELIAPFTITDDRRRSLGWQLVRDLLMIKMVEELDKQHWFGTHPNALEEVSAADHRDEAEDEDEGV